MNFRIIAYIVGWVCNFQAAFMMLPLLTAGIYREKDFSAFLLAMLVCLVVGVPLTRKKPKNKVFYQGWLRCRCTELACLMYFWCDPVCCQRMYPTSDRCTV